MSILCKTCKHEVGVGFLIGYLCAKGVQTIGPYLINIYFQSRRTLTDEMVYLLVGIANVCQVQCAFCSKYEGWEYLIDNEIHNDL